MKKIFAILVLSFLFCEVDAQVIVSGRITDTNGDTAKQKVVYMYSDTSVVNPIIPLTMDTTDSTGLFSFQLSNTTPGGTVFYVSTFDCNNIVIKKNTHIFTGNNINSPFTICSSPSTKFTGYVHLGDASLRPDKGQATVYLISKCGSNALSYIDSVNTDTNGYFEVDSYPILGAGCDLIMQAKLKSTSQHLKEYFPAYHDSNNSYSLRWSNARNLPFPATQSGVIITMPKGINPHGGPSKIAGHSRNSSGNALPDKIIFITDNVDIPVDYLYSTYIGDFAFINIPFGRYKLFGDVWGKDNPELVVKVDADAVYIDNIVFTESSTEYRGRIAVSVVNATGVLSRLSVYPNPADDIIHIGGAEKILGEKQVFIRDITGKVVAQKSFEDHKEIIMPVSNLNVGLYLIQLSTSSGVATFKMTK